MTLKFYDLVTKAVDSALGLEQLVTKHLCFFLNRQGIHFVERGKMIHKQDLCSYLWKGIVYPHQKLHNRFSRLQINKSLIHITCAFATTTRRRRTIILQLILENLQLSEEISNGNLTLMEVCNFSRKLLWYHIRNLWWKVNSH